MITTDGEYQKAPAELRSLERWLEKTLQPDVRDSKTCTRAGISKMISRLREELALYEAALRP